MITLKWQPKAYPTKTIIEDLMDRTGPATEDCWSNFDGQKEELDSQFNGYAKNIFSRVEFLSFKRNTDFDPLRLKPARERLEDFPTSEEAAAYFRQYCIGYKLNTKGSYMQTKGIRYQPMYEDSDTGEVNTIASFEETYNEAPELDRRQLFDRLTYLVKMIWFYSIERSANLFSFAFAYWDMLKTNTVISRRAFRKYADAKRLFRIRVVKDPSRAGVYMEPFDHDEDQKYRLYTDAMDIFIYRADTEVYKICIEFCRILEELGFDCSKEDPSEYTPEFCHSLPCLYVDSTVEFMRGAAFISQIENAGYADNPQNKFVFVGADKAACTTRLHRAKNLYLEAMKGSYFREESGVDWQDVILAILTELGITDEVKRRSVLKGLVIRNDMVYNDATNEPLGLDYTEQCGALEGCTGYKLYLLSGGELMTVLLNPITRETKIYYSIPRKEKLGYGGIVWRQLEVDGNL